MNIIVNHIGYETKGYKTAILNASLNENIKSFSILDINSGKKIYTSKNIKYVGLVKKWKNKTYWIIDFSDYSKPGNYKIIISADKQNHESFAFNISDNLFIRKTITDIMFFFKSQRCSGIFEKKDYSLPFFGDRKGTIDAHGGWFDASGDNSKYLSHLNYTNYMNPQQTPLAAWGMIDAYINVQESSIINDLKIRLKERFLDEAIHGSDFLLRMLDDEGYFYTTIFDRWSHEPGKRHICSYSLIIFCDTPASVIISTYRLHFSEWEI